MTAAVIRDVRLTFTPTVPPEVESAARPLLQVYLAFVPRWCTLVQVRFAAQHPTSDGADAQVTQEEPYGWAHVTLYAEWLLSSANEREETIAHEIAHTILRQADRVLNDVLDAVDAMMPDAKAFRLVIERARRNAQEAAVTDLTRILRAAANNLNAYYGGGTHGG